MVFRYKNRVQTDLHTVSHRNRPISINKYNPVNKLHVVSIVYGDPP